MSSTYICCIHIVIIYKRIYFTVTYVKWPLIVTYPSVYFMFLRHTRCAPQTGNPDNRVALWECVKSRIGVGRFRILGGPRFRILRGGQCLEYWGGQGLEYWGGQGGAKFPAGR